MEHARRGEGNDDTSKPLPPKGKAGQRLTPEPRRPGDPAEDLPDLEAPDTPAMAGYLTLELDASDLQALVIDMDPAPGQIDWRGQECQEPEAEAPPWPEGVTQESDLDMPELLELEDQSLPGYLTLEIDLNALENESRRGQEKGKVSQDNVFTPLDQQG